MATPPPSTTPSSSHLLTVKLTHDNFLLWKAQIIPYFKRQNLFGFLDGSHPAPPPLYSITNTPSSAFLTWQQHDQSIISILNTCLSKNLISHVLSATTSYEIWLILDDLFVAKTQAHTMQLHYQIATLKKGSKFIADYYQQAKLLCYTLSMTRKTLSSFITYLLAGLGFDYELVVTSITVCRSLHPTPGV